MGCNCRNKNNQATEATTASKLAEARRSQLREVRAKEQAKANAKQK